MPMTVPAAHTHVCGFHQKVSKGRGLEGATALSCTKAMGPTAFSCAQKKKQTKKPTSASFCIRGSVSSSCIENRLRAHLPGTTSPHSMSSVRQVLSEVIFSVYLFTACSPRENISSTWRLFTKQPQYQAWSLPCGKRKLEVTELMENTA